MSGREHPGSGAVVDVQSKKVSQGTSSLAAKSKNRHKFCLDAVLVKVVLQDDGGSQGVVTLGGVAAFPGLYDILCCGRRKSFVLINYWNITALQNLLGK